MKGMDELKFPDDISYTVEHIWVKKINGVVKMGITDFAQNQLGEIVFVDLPDLGEAFEKGEDFGTVESVKAASEIYMPMDGEIININTELDESPELINNSPYEDGWIIEARPECPDKIDNLLTASVYKETIR